MTRDRMLLKMAAAPHFAHGDVDVPLAGTHACKTLSA